MGNKGGIIHALCCSLPRFVLCSVWMSMLSLYRNIVFEISFVVTFAANIYIYTIYIYYNVYKCLSFQAWSTMLTWDPVYNRVSANLCGASRGLLLSTGFLFALSCALHTLVCLSLSPLAILMTWRSPQCLRGGGFSSLRMSLCLCPGPWYTVC